MFQDQDLPLMALFGRNKCCELAIFLSKKNKRISVGLNEPTSSQGLRHVHLQVAAVVQQLLPQFLYSISF